jgi:hypothetical protein
MQGPIATVGAHGQNVNWNGREFKPGQGPRRGDAPKGATKSTSAIRSLVIHSLTCDTVYELITRKSAAASPMHWIRSRIRFGSRLALFALAVQTLLSFGHVHFVASATGATNGMPPAIADQSDAAFSRVPAPFHKPDGSVGGDCAICTLIQLASSSTPAVAPSLPLPANLCPLGLEAAAERPLPASLHFSFQARAPPSI